MLLKYDLHVHSGLSPCAENDMTPCNIVGFAKLNGLDMVAISDHNAIGNVKVAIEVGKAYGVTVVPAMELQTAEDIHVLCLFPSYEALKVFYDFVGFYDIKNRPEIFGNQYLYDCDDEIVGEEERLLLNASKISCDDIKEIVDGFGGIAIPAHVDREENGMVAVLGTVTEEFTAVELSTRATSEQILEYSKVFNVIVDSDAHTLDKISSGRLIDLPENSASALITHLKQRVKFTQ